MRFQVGICTGIGGGQANKFIGGLFAGETVRDDFFTTIAPTLQSALASEEKILVVGANRGLEGLLCVHLSSCAVEGST
jgi:hypothetical protein